MALVGPAPMLDSNPFTVMLQDLRDERFAGLAFPPGETRFSIPRTRRFANEPLEMLLENYERETTASSKKGAPEPVGTR